MKEQSFILGIDIGGTSVKAGLFDDNGELRGSGYSECEMVSTVPGQAEHDAESWWRAAIHAIRLATAEVPPAAVKGIGVGCTNGLIAVDQDARPIRPALMLWDQRALTEIDAIGDHISPDDIINITGNPVAPGAYSLPSMLWLKNNEPRTFQDAFKLLVPGGYIVARLTGEFTIDYSRAATTLLFDVKKKRWHKPFLEALDIPGEKLPRPVASDQIVGGLKADIADLLGLEPATPVVGGCMDTIGAAVGTGILTNHECFIVMGTAARVSAVLDTPVFDPRFMHCGHVLDGHWLSIGAINGVGSSLRWMRDTFCQIEETVAEFTGANPYDLITAQARKSPPGSKGLLFLPYISGERTPVWDPYARGVFLGVTLGHNRADFFRSVLEGTAFAIRHVIDIMEQERGLTIEQIYIGGAAASNAVWNRIIADVSGKTIVSITQSHTEVLGAAIIAGVGTGFFTDYPSAVSTAVRSGDVFSPDSQSHQAYNRMFPIYKDLYHDLKRHFKQIAQMDLPQGWVVTGK